MNKRYLLAFTLVLLLCIMTSCAVNKSKAPDINDTEVTLDNTSETLAVESEEITVQQNTDTAVQTEKTPVENQDELVSNETENAIGGGDYPCTVHHTKYHSIPSTIIELIGGEEVYYNLCAEYNAENMSCPLPSIKYIIDEFDITVDEFAETVRLIYSPYYDLDVLFNGTLEDADELFTDQEWIIFTCSSLCTCYMDLYGEIEDEYPAAVDAIDGGIRSLSIPEVVKLLDITREDFEEMIKESSDNGNKQTYNYNLDMLYGPDGTIIFEKPDGVSSFELEEMFCRTGRHAE